jgi:hypothetical protein
MRNLFRLVVIRENLMSFLTGGEKTHEILTVYD